MDISFRQVQKKYCNKYDRGGGIYINHIQKMDLTFCRSLYTTFKKLVLHLRKDNFLFCSKAIGALKLCKPESLTDGSFTVKKVEIKEKNKNKEKM